MSMNLRPRFLLIALVIALASASLSWLAVRALAEQIVERWAMRYAEKQARYDKARTLQPILREIALSRQLASSRAILDWARDPDDRDLRNAAILEMESFRLNFADRSYFVALLESGDYFHNNSKDEFAGRQYRYTLDSKRPADAWFYDIVRQNRDMHLNVNPDVHLGVTKLWIDVLIRDGERVLGVAGTGLDLSQFISDFEAGAEPGIATLMVDHERAIQVWRDQTLIDFASISKGSEAKKTLSLLFPAASDSAAIREAMKRVAAQPVGTQSRGRVELVRVGLGGRGHLAAVVYLPEVDWYEITLIDIGTLITLGDFRGIFAVLALTLLAVLVALHLALSRMVLRPVSRLESAVKAMRVGQFDSAALPAGGAGELGRLTRHFSEMAGELLHSRAELEARVQARTEDLERLTRTDPLTGLLNRRGMTARIEAEISRAHRGHGRFGLLCLDIDWFKEINDRHGHDVGDRTLQRLAALLEAETRSYDSAARWGGDEFMVLLRDCDRENLLATAERIRAAAAAQPEQEGAPGFTVSIGAALAGDESEQAQLLHDADRALYQAKALGRDQVVIDTELADVQGAAEQLAASGAERGSIVEEPAARQQEVEDLVREIVAGDPDGDSSNDATQADLPPR
jgi:diguanylate cyclase (GGDEF)-like protein